MRLRRLLPLPLALILVLVPAGPAMALDWSVEVTDFAFTPQERHIAVGDTVTWSFTDSGHTSTAVRGQADYWSSGAATVPAGGTYRRSFDRPGRFQYVCIPHRAFMRGVIEVGEDAEGDTVDRLRTRRRGRTVTLAFTLNEAATATYRLRGPSRRTVRRGRLEEGRHRIKLRRLRPGAYRGTLGLADDFDNRVRPKTYFVVR